MVFLNSKCIYFSLVYFILFFMRFFYYLHLPFESEHSQLHSPMACTHLIRTHTNTHKLFINQQNRWPLCACSRHRSQTQHETDIEYDTNDHESDYYGFSEWCCFTLPLRSYICLFVCTLFDRIFVLYCCRLWFLFRVNFFFRRNCCRCCCIVFTGLPNYLCMSDANSIHIL